VAGGSTRGICVRSNEDEKKRERGGWSHTASTTVTFSRGAKEGERAQKDGRRSLARCCATGFTKGRTARGICFCKDEQAGGERHSRRAEGGLDRKKET